MLPTPKDCCCSVLVSWMSFYEARQGNCRVYHLKAFSVLCRSPHACQISPSPLDRPIRMHCTVLRAPNNLPKHPSQANVSSGHRTEVVRKQRRDHLGWLRATRRGFEYLPNGQPWSKESLAGETERRASNRQACFLGKRNRAYPLRNAGLPNIAESVHW